MNVTLPKTALATIDRYLNLPLGNKLVQCPYFKNKAGVRAGLKVYLGKGSPDEIIEETNTVARKEKIDLTQLSDKEIRNFMEQHNLGIDCSGFVSQILCSLDSVIIKQIAKRNFLKNPIRSIVTKLRPIENISVKTLTNINNSAKLNKWHDLKPGDLIKTSGGKHVLIITSATFDKNLIKEFTYHHSTDKYNSLHGVKKGVVKAIYPHEELKDQDWTEIDANNGKCHALESLLDNYEQNGIYRLKSLANFLT